MCVKEEDGRFRYHIVESHKGDEINRTFGQCFDLAYHFWCGSAKYQHQQYQADLAQLESRVKKLELANKKLERRTLKSAPVSDAELSRQEESSSSEDDKDETDSEPPTQLGLPLKMPRRFFEKFLKIILMV